MADGDVLVLIPARMASTRLPGKPLADIAGLPMIVHVMRRAQAAQLGPVVVATDSEVIAASVEKAGGRAVMTRADHASGSDRIFEALQAVDPRGPRRHRRQRAGRPADARPRRPRPRARTARRSGRRHRHAGRRDPARARAHRPERGQGGRHAGRPAPPARALFHPRHRAVWRRPALPSHRALRLSARGARSASSACRPRRWRRASGSSSCARSRPACASTWRSSTACRSASIRPRTWRGHSHPGGEPLTCVR